MARDGADVLSKKNNKLQAFLKRNLDADTFERVRASESCIVCSEKEDKAFKFVVLSDEWIYLTENPPKKIYETVHLADVVSVSLVSDFPAFLSGEERENTQHIVIKYLTPDLKKTNKGKNGKSKKKSTSSLEDSSSKQESPRIVISSSRTSSSGFSSNGSNSSGFLSSRSVKTPRTARSKSPRNSIVHLDRSLLTSKSSDSLRTGSWPWQRKAASWKGKDSERHGDRDLTRTASVSADIMRTALSPGRKDLAPPGTGANLKSASDSNLAAQSTTSNLASTMRNRYASTTYDELEKRPRPLPNPADEWDEDGEYLDKRKKEPLHVRYGDSGELKLDLRKLDSNSDDDSEKDRSSLAPPGTTSRKLSSGSISPRVSSQTESEAGDEGFEDDNSVHVREAIIHLYILSHSSPILMLTRSAWNNYLIRATMEEDPDYVYRTMGVTPRAGQSAPASEKLGQLFSQLKTDLFNPNNTMEDLFELMCELKCAAARNPTLKKLFWKTSEMLQFIVQQLQLYLPRSPVQPQMAALSEEEQKERRADEFDYVLALIETLALMFRETETVPSRLQCLRAASGKTTRDLLVALTCFPEAPHKYVPPSTKAQQLLNSTERDNWKCVADVDLTKLMQELTNTSTAVLFELILIAHQANWGDSQGKFFNICWMVKVLDELNTTEKFVERVVSELIRLISPSRSELLPPKQAILIYHQLHVLQTLLEYSPHTAAFIRNNFYEEFKYYIQAPIISQKLCDSYAIRPHIIRLLEEVMSVVLQKTVSLNLH